MGRVRRDVARCNWQRNDYCCCCFWYFSSGSICATWIREIEWTSCIWCQDGFYAQNTLGKRWTLDTRSWSINFSGVVPWHSVRIALTYAALNEIPVNAADIQNAYLQAPYSEKHFISCGDEFDLENNGRIALIVCTLYGGKSSGSDFWKHLHSRIEHLNLTACKAGT